MKRNIKISLVLVSVFALVLLASSNVLARRTSDDDCNSCHSDPSGITISAVSTIEVDAGETFQLDVQATGLASEPNFILKILSDAPQIDPFIIEFPSADGLVEDDTGADLDTDPKEIHVVYNITAPNSAGEYTLTVYAAQDWPYGESWSITVNVAQVGEGPLIGAPSTTPEVPRANQEFVVTVEVTSIDVVESVTLQYSTTNGSSWVDVPMTETSEAGFYTGTIPGFARNQTVLWRIVASDSLGTQSSPTFSYVVGQIPVEPIVLPQFHYGWLLGAPALFLAYLGTALEYYDEERFTRIHGIMLSLAYILTTINVLSLLMDASTTLKYMNPAYLIDLSNMLYFMHSWHVWLGIISMILGTLAFITHLGGWKTCNLGLPAVVLWTILGIMGVYLGEVFVM